MSTHFLIYRAPTSVAQSLGVDTTDGLVGWPRGVEGLPLDVDAEEAVAAIRSLPGMYWEPDGSLAWSGMHTNGERWELTGLFYEQGDRLWYGDLHGRCPAERWSELLSCFSPLTIAALVVDSEPRLLRADQLCRLWWPDLA